MKKQKKPLGGLLLKKSKYTNKEASGFGYIGFNFKRELFQDKQVRKALAHLFNRELINKKFIYGQAELARGPWYFWSDYADPNVKAIEFNPEKAIQILKKAGWNDKDKKWCFRKNNQWKK